MCQNIYDLLTNQLFIDWFWNGVALLAVILASIFWFRQLKISKYQIKISSIWNKVSWLSSEIAIWQSKLEHMISEGRELEGKLTENDMKLFFEWLDWIKKALDDLYQSRNETLDLYDEEIKK